jgi:hypothetical protein
MSPDDDQPTADPAPVETQDAPALDAPASEGGAEAPAPAAPDAPRRKRRRRRRKVPRPPGEGQGAIADGGIIAATGAAAPGEAPRTWRAPGPPGERPHSRGPRNRPHRPREGGAEGAPADPNAPPQDGRPRQDRPFRSRGPRREGPRRDGPGRDGPRGDRPPREGEAPAPAPQGQDERPARGREDRPRDGFRGKRPGGRDGRHGDDRRPARPEPKLITTESTVDRGFEDVPDEANEGATLRVTWTIVKRTVADQRTAKLVSATYVLKRGEVDADFPSLAAARAAVNKTIVHPEKLTLSKADHAAQRGSGKK